jgi:hypothetical protein
MLLVRHTIGIACQAWARMIARADKSLNSRVHIHGLTPR